MYYVKIYYFYLIMDYFINIYYKNYNNQQEKYIIYFAIIYSSSIAKIYNMELLHLVIYLKKL